MEVMCSRKRQIMEDLESAKRLKLSTEQKIYRLEQELSSVGRS